VEADAKRINVKALSGRRSRLLHCSLSLKHFLKKGAADPPKSMADNLEHSHSIKNKKIGKW
jgi:hypothetical protein